MKGQYILYFGYWLLFSECYTSPRSLSYNKSITLIETGSPVSVIECFLLQFPVSSHFLKVLSSSSVPSTFPSITCSRRQFLCKMWPIHSAFILCVVCRIFLFSLTLSNTSSFSDNHSNWPPPSFSSTSTKLSSKCSASLGFSLILIQVR